MTSHGFAVRSRTELTVVIGAGGHGKVVADALSLMLGRDIDGFIDCNEALEGSSVLGYSVLGGHEWLFREASERPIAAAVGIGNDSDRQRLIASCIDSGIQVLTVVHPQAAVSKSAVVGAGSVVLAKAVLNPNSRVGQGAIINTAAIVEHDVEIGDFAHLAPNSTTGGAVRIGACCQIGLGAQILPSVSVGSGTCVGAGAVVLHDLPKNVVAIGNPARILRKAGNGNDQQPGRTRDAFD
jgi:sugar O-acyltransferase (sialic acid O-acetyltransferase NeuD family)